MESVEWHKNCLRNQKSYVQELKEELQRKADQVQSLEEGVVFYSLQIETAEKKKKLSFNRDLFLKKRKKS